MKALGEGRKLFFFLIIPINTCDRIKKKPKNKQQTNNKKNPKHKKEDQKDEQGWADTQDLFFAQQKKK